MSELTDALDRIGEAMEASLVVTLAERMEMPDGLLVSVVMSKTPLVLFHEWVYGQKTVQTLTDTERTSGDTSDG